MSHRRLLAALLSIAGALLAAGSVVAAPAPGPLLLAEAGKAHAVIVVAKDADTPTREAAGLLRSYIDKATGVTLAVLTESDAAARQAAARVHVGRTPATAALEKSLAGLDDDGFVIAPVGEHDLAIVGPTPWGTEFGVCEFLERYVGVRWLLPGPDGEDVPRADRLAVPRETVRQEPAFFSRQFSGLRGDAQNEWARCNRMHPRVSFHHNLIRLFPPEKYAATHPEFFPIRGGKRYLPKDSSVHGWQPCFTAPGLVEEAIRNINAYFAENPAATSYSLGVNDSSGHCECARCQARDTGEKNFLGLRDVSDRYFEWANQVVEGVLKQYPDKYFGCLAYSEVAAPPTRVKVHPRIVPYMTYDRMKWTVPAIRAEGEETTRRWHAASPTVGWYDYIYGSPYCLPRVYFHRMAENYRFAHANGVRVQYAEAYPNWGEGPKLYVSLKLQWNPALDVDALLREWYERAVGPAAAADLAAYYAQWEQFWTERAAQTRWYTARGQYLAFNNPGYLEAVTEEEIAHSRRLLEAVLNKADTEPRKARARLLLRAFEYYEASALAYPRATQAEETPADEAAALALLDAGIRRARMAERRSRLVAEFVDHPVLAHPLPLDRFGLLSGRDWGGETLWRVLDWVARGQGPVRQRVEQMAAETQPSALRDQARLLLELADGKLTSLAANPSFEEGTAAAPPWNLWVKNVGSIRRVETVARTGKASILCKGLDRGGPNQVLKLAPGRYGAVAFVYLPAGTQTKGTVQLSMTLRDTEGRNLPSPSAIIHPRPGVWVPVAVAAEIPAQVGGKAVESVLLVPILDGFAEGEEVYLDDVAVYRLEK